MGGVVGLGTEDTVGLGTEDTVEVGVGDGEGVGVGTGDGEDVGEGVGVGTGDGEADRSTASEGLSSSVESPAATSEEDGLPRSSELPEGTRHAETRNRTTNSESFRQECSPLPDRNDCSFGIGAAITANSAMRMLAADGKKRMAETAIKTQRIHSRIRPAFFIGIPPGEFYVFLVF